MQFVPSEGNPTHEAMVEELDNLVQHLVHLDIRGREAAREGDVEVGGQVSLEVGTTLNNITWGAIPTVIMHFATHVAQARMDAGRMSQTCMAAADGLRAVSQTLSEAGAPVELCAQLMDLAVQLRESGEDCLFELSDCQHGTGEGDDCGH